MNEVRVRVNKLWMDIIILLIILNTSLHKVLGFSFDTQIRLINAAIAFAGAIFVVRYSAGMHGIKYINKLGFFILAFFTVECLYTVFTHGNYSIFEWTNSIIFVLLYTGLAYIVSYLITIDNHNLVKILKWIAIATFCSYIIRYFIQYVYAVSGSVIFPSIAYECASEKWMRNGMLRINPPCFAIIIIPIAIYLFSDAKSRIAKAFYIALVVIALHYSYSVQMARSMFLYQGLTLIIFFVISRTLSRKSFIISIVSILAILLAYLLGFFDSVFEMIDSIIHVDSSAVYGDTVTVRLYATNYYYQWMLKNPVLGIGALTNTDLTASLISGHISDLGFLGNIFRFGLLGVFLEIFTLGRMFYIAIKLFRKKYRNHALSKLCIGVSLSTILVSTNIDCFYFLFCFAYPFSLAITEWIFYHIRTNDMAYSTETAFVYHPAGAAHPYGYAAVGESADVQPPPASYAYRKRGIRFVWKPPIWLDEDDGRATGIREENVSFAVFDTLIRRSVGRPADLFRIMEQNDPSVPEHFAEKRIEAEQAVRAKLGARMGLADIYEELLPLYGSRTNDLLALEIQYEIAGCRPVADNIDLVNLCMEHDKNVFLIADTYLPSSVIRRMLDVCGVYHYDRLYVSCEEGACKADGSLFWKVLADQEIRPSELRHIGSDRQGDVTEPWRVGVHVKRGKKKGQSTVDKELPEDIALYERTLQSCIQNCVDDLDSDNARLGCETFGPLLAGFTAWLREQLRRDGIQDVYFLAGDGAVLKQAFDALEDGSFRTYSLYFPAQTADQDHEALTAYLRACGMQGRVALVDTGRQAAVQKALESLIAEAGLDIQVKGYYVGLNADTDGMQAAGYLYEPGKGTETLEKLSPIMAIFNTVFHAQHGAVRRIVIRDGQPVPELDDSEYAPDEGRICDEIAILRAYQAGAIELVREMNDAFPGGVPRIPDEAVLLPLLRMGTKPTRQEAELWGDFRVFEDGKATPMARPKGMGYYLLHPGRLKRDYAASPWKIGFLRRLIRLPLAYDKIVKNR